MNRAWGFVSWSMVFQPGRAKLNVMLQYVLCKPWRPTRSPEHWKAMSPAPAWARWQNEGTKRSPLRLWHMLALLAKFWKTWVTVGSLAASVILFFFCVCLLIFETGSHYAALTGPTLHRPVLNSQRSVCLCLVRARIKYKYHNIFPPSSCFTPSSPCSHAPYTLSHFLCSSESHESYAGRLQTDYVAEVHLMSLTSTSQVLLGWHVIPTRLGIVWYLGLNPWLPAC